MKRPEILSPGGDADSVKAAIAAGADAVYTGLKKFNARKRAENISESALKELIGIAHSRNTDIYVTMNVLMVQNEMHDALQTAERLHNSGVDGLIVQDAGFAYLLRKYLPEIKIHASTQFTTHNSLQLDFLKSLNFMQVNFSRELSLAELRITCTEAHKREMKTEVFVHGAYCVSCSGICYFSSFTAGESANRGACVQLCRRLYSTETEGKKFYLLNLKDNNASAHALELAEAGADVFKIEGRIKNFYYVYKTTDAWRRKMEELFENGYHSGPDIDEDMRSVFNRNFTAGYLEENISPEMFNETPFDQSMKYFGKIISYTADTAIITADTANNSYAGGKISIFTPERSFICTAEILETVSDGRFKIRIENILMGKILRGQLIYLTGDSNNINEVRKKLDSLHPVKEKLDIEFSGREGTLLKAVFTGKQGKAAVQSSTLLAQARKNAIDAEMLTVQFGRTGGTDFEIGKVDISALDKNLFLPVSELNAMKREALESFKKRDRMIDFIESENKKLNGMRKTALLFSNVSDFHELDDKTGYLCFLEMTAASRSSDFSENLHPWIPAFIIDAEMDAYIELLRGIKPVLAVCDNSGIGSWCSRNGIKWIAGPELNLCNGYAFNAFREFGAAGGFFSHEISSVQMNDFNVPEGFLTFCRIFSPMLMMTSRQCFFLNAGKCRSGKSRKDRSCLNGCQDFFQFFDEHGKKFHVEKKKGYINRIFADGFQFIPEAVIDVSCDYFLLDLRKFDFTPQDAALHPAIINFISSSVRSGILDNDSYRGLKERLGNVSKGCYYRGFEQAD